MKDRGVDEKALGLAYPTEGFIHVEDSKGDQCGERADPTSRTVGYEATGTMRFWEHFSFSSPTISQTSQLTWRKGLCWLTFQRSCGALVLLLWDSGANVPQPKCLTEETSWEWKAEEERTGLLLSLCILKALSSPKAP